MNYRHEPGRSNGLSTHVVHHMKKKLSVEKKLVKLSLIMRDNRKNF